jgi:hypothetical protein
VEIWKILKESLFFINDDFQHYSITVVSSIVVYTQAEIQKQVGTIRLPGLEDREHMPYTAAVLMEVARCGNIVPLGVQHMPAR